MSDKNAIGFFAGLVSRETGLYYRFFFGGPLHFHKLATGKFPTAALVSFLVPQWGTLGYSLHALIAYQTPESLLGEEG